MRNFPRYLSLFLVTIASLSVLIVKLGGADFPAQAGPTFDADIAMEIRRQIDAQEPQIILLGDSMVDLNVDALALAESLNHSIYPISHHGAGSVMYYLTIKNNIVVAAHKPQALIILFRDSVLTTPEYRAGPDFTEYIELRAGENEALLLQLAYLNHMNPLEKTAQRFFPLYQYDNQLPGQIENSIRYSFTRFLFRCNRNCVDSAFYKIFNFRTVIPPSSNDPVAQSESVLYTSHALDFSAQVGNSFLPEIIRLCRENGLPLILVRGKTISFAQLPKPYGLDNYILELKEYLTKNGVGFADLETDPRLGVGDFVDRFHVQPEARGKYTQMLAEALAPLLP
jgi:hypothetical protein